MTKNVWVVECGPAPRWWLYSCWETRNAARASIRYNLEEGLDGPYRIRKYILAED